MNPPVFFDHAGQFLVRSHFGSPKYGWAAYPTREAWESAKCLPDRYLSDADVPVSGYVMLITLKTGEVKEVPTDWHGRMADGTSFKVWLAGQVGVEAVSWRLDVKNQ